MEILGIPITSWCHPMITINNKRHYLLIPVNIETNRRIAFFKSDSLPLTLQKYRPVPDASHVYPG